MEKIAFAYALVEHPKKRSNWLVKRRVDISRHAKWDFLQSERLEMESFRDSVLREVGWELNVNPKKEILVSRMPQLNFEKMGVLDSDRGLLNAWEDADGEAPFHYVIEFYKVFSYCRDFCDRIEQKADLDWVTTKDLFSGVYAETAISPRLIELLRLTEVIQPWR